jgi:hypothetical protein
VVLGVYRYDPAARSNVTRVAELGPAAPRGAGTAALREGPRDRRRSLAAVPGGCGRYFVYPSSLFAAITYELVYVPARLIGRGALPMNFSIVYTVCGPLAGIIPSGRN